MTKVKLLMTNNLDKKIEELEKKIKDFGKKYAGDVLGSYNEGTQAAMSMQMLNKQLDELKSKKENSDSNQSSDKIFLLKEKEELQITLTSGEINSKNFVISFNSPIGQKLMNSKIGDTILLRDKKYKILEIK